MSLLLDALKKAADDKQKITQEKAVEEDSVVDKEPVKNTASTDSEELTLDPLESNTRNTSEVEVNLEEPALEEITKQTADIAEFSSEAVAVTKDAVSDATASKKVAETTYTVSDEALSMLIYKTNREVKKSKRIVTVSVLLLSTLILIAGGVYSYMDMQAEIFSLERKHQIATLAMQSKTSDDVVPAQSEIIRNLVGDSNLEDKVEFAKHQMASEKNNRQVQKQTSVISNKKNSVISAAMSIQKTNKVDPVTENLEKAWIAYDNGQYKQSKKIYKKVLESEKNNRDALLGLGAIAVIEKNNQAAKNIYQQLLKQDPRDSIAIAALISLRDTEAVTETDEKHLVHMLQKSPGDAHLNFALGNMYSQQGKWKQAQQSYFNAWQIDSENADYLFNLAVSMDQLGKSKQAIDFYQFSLDKSKNKQVSFSREAVQNRISKLVGL